MNKKSFLKIIIGSFLATGMAYSSGAFNTEIKSYHKMSTYELQQHIEKLSQHGEVPFDMGVELIHRWSNYKV